MDADEIVPITREAIRDLLEARKLNDADAGPLGRRKLPRWPFPGTVEVWLPTPGGHEEHVIGTVHDLSEQGVGVRTDVEIRPGQVLSIAIHQPEASLHGRAIVRHCSARQTGYHIGFEFKFD